jgi:uncharacterized protein YndB with AHSA1/START domain
MPANKDFKRLVRARMTKTGESYTAARSQLLKRRQTKTASDGSRRAVPVAALARDYAKIAGMSDTALEAKTGCTWKRWVDALDHLGAVEMSHREIAKLIREQYETPSWWAQTVTVGYERIRGLRDVGQRRGGTYEISKSKTLPASVSALYRAFRDESVRAGWLGTPAIVIRTAARNKSMRITWSDGTPVQVSFTAKGKTKSQVGVQHAKLPDKEAATRMKAFWGGRLEALATLLGSGHERAG